MKTIYGGRRDVKLAITGVTQIYYHTAYTKDSEFPDKTGYIQISGTFGNVFDRNINVSTP